jgi:ubiquinone biosynthesis protein
MRLLEAVLVGGSMFALVVAFAVVARRLLGVRFGAVRTLVAGVLAFVVAGPIARLLIAPTTTPSVTPLWFLILATACALLVAMVFLVVAEAVVPTTSRGPIDWVRGLHSWFARTRRYAQISRILVRHGLWQYVGGRSADLDAPGGRVRLARSLRRALDDGGVTFVKLGQVMSTRRDVLPDEIVDELERLQDQAATGGWEPVAQLLASELGGPVEEVFAEFERTPLAAASIAQVHAARLPSGDEVVVKVQRPGIRSVVERDLDIVARLARRLELATRWGRSVGAVGLAHGFAEAIREELDFRIEARNMAAVVAAGQRYRDGAVRFPTPHEPLCTERVLVMQRLDGTPLWSAQPIIAELGLDQHALARSLLETLLRQIMVDGVFHADPHPGNVLLLADGRLGLLDFGSVGRLDQGLRDALQRLLLAVDRGDTLGVSDALLEVVVRPDEVDEQGLERSLGQFMARHLAPGMSPGVRMFADLFRIVSTHGLSVPPEMAAVFRALATLEGTLVRIAPGFDLVSEARAFSRRSFADRLDATALSRAATAELTALLPMLRRLPRRVERISAAVEHGRLSVNVRLFADERDRSYTTGLLHQILLTVLGATAGVMAVQLLGVGGGPAVTTTVSLFQLLGYNLLVISAILVLRVLVGIFRRSQ